jgi:hypothetical protein
MRGKFLKVWGCKSNLERKKSRSGMSATTRLVVRYKLLSTFLFVSTGAAFQGAPQPDQNPIREAREAMVQAIEDGRLVSPTGDSAWDLYQRYVQYPLEQSQRREANDRIVNGRRPDTGLLSPRRPGNRARSGSV